MKKNSMFLKNKTSRGFKIYNFWDEQGLTCNIQEASFDSTIWLGVEQIKPLIMYKDAKSIGLDLKKKKSNSGRCCLV